MRLPSEIQGTREERVAQFKNDAELMGVATKLVSEVIEKAKGEAMKRRKSGAVSQQASVEQGRGQLADARASLDSGAAPEEAVPVSAQRIKLALGNIKERVSTAYGSLAERLRTGYRVSLERPAWARAAADRPLLRNPFTRRGSGQGAAAAPAAPAGAANGGAKQGPPPAQAQAQQGPGPGLAT